MCLENTQYPLKVQNLAFYLCRLRLLLLHFSSDEAVQHGLEQVDHERDILLVLVTGQVDHFVLVARH